MSTVKVFVDGKEEIIIIEEILDDKKYKKLDGEWKFIRLPNLPPVDCSKDETINER